ncbi:MAG: CYTH domain-containing protein [Candidatus Marinimicrobia bacterium]|jgi:CYTH domain-containing protein|nr:CYTH domain-containing protein [Candidatus Neomarinimicrobiota bacterium]MBT3630074.1 CYTH domain-containing protein [Candidatus Neomarinimicrobiota bacterium]MBT3824241.1 CYTH domain-containing protein [Candidatus Neomarinimicrobiota bacterium]MBT4131693.1 CYTH domain-containing protein [Candidatus Neomarinimicrobiota bacterium]MBT4295477.1 CYTH domain-containing protein [Candidatus Neomarinimicrobiota bacterium]
MGQEIERKFLVTATSYRDLAKGTHYKQGYLNSQKERVVRVRTIDETGFMTVKGITKGATRLEYEYEIPAKDADELLELLCEQPIIDKHRYKVPMDGFVWEIDEFHGENEGLTVAEIELLSEDQEFSKPDWVGEEVTGDPRYYNSNLIANPYTKW